MKYYINSLRRSDALTRDLKELVTDMNLRRRMSPVVRMGVATGLESLDDFGEVDAVITATGLGCIGDSEKFLRNLITAQEQQLNPTPFIQSTFNTVGAQIALIRHLNGYNNTFSHRYTSFESALLEAMLRLATGDSRAVLVEMFDEATESVRQVVRRLELTPTGWGEGAVALVLTAEKGPKSVAEVELQLTPEQVPEGAVRVSQTEGDPWFGATAWRLAEAVKAGDFQIIVNDMGGELRSLIKCCCL